MSWRLISVTIEHLERRRDLVRELMELVQRNARCQMRIMQLAQGIIAAATDQDLEKIELEAPVIELELREIRHRMEEIKAELEQLND